ncbi:MAG: CHASE domain-containing protein [Kofleriaceae bacterium]|nr:CHASE domain-containing protein [Kofleriaceae bacterium]
MTGTGPARGRVATQIVLPAAAVLLAGLIATWIAVGLLRERERGRERVEVARRATDLAARIEQAFVVPLQAVYGLAAHLHAVDLDLDAAGFRRFAADAVTRQPSIYALEWAPVVTDAERAAVEARAQAEGQPRWEIKERAPGGGWQRAATRPWYVPLRFAEPPNDALGFDLVSLADRMAHVIRSRDAALTIATERLQLVEDPPGVWSVAVYDPVWRGGTAPAGRDARAAALAGFAIAVFRVRPVIEGALEDAHLDDLDVALIDASGSPGNRVLWESSAGAADRAAAASPPAGGEFHFLDRTWQVTVAHHDAGAPALAASRLALYGGLLISALAAALFVGFRVARRLERSAASARRLGQYQLLEPIGRGGMGVVYAARHVLLRRPTAVKLLAPDATDAASLERFTREVRLTSELTHPNVIAVYDYGHSPDGVFYYAMELLDGITLDELIRVDGPQPVARTVHLIRQLTSAIAEAHGRGLVHRDLKPANLMLVERGGDPDFLKVLDFGLVKRLEGAEIGDLDDDAAGDATDADAARRPRAATGSDDGRPRRLTGAGVLFGTPGFSAPEAVLGEPTEAAADVYSIGAVWYDLLAGRPPFKGASARAVSYQQLTATVPAPSRWRPERGDHVDAVPAEIDALVLRCMDRKPGARPTAAALLDAIEALATPPWTRAQARLWWATHGAAVRSVAKLRLERPASDERASLDVDLHRRDAR